MGGKSLRKKKLLGGPASKQGYSSQKGQLNKVAAKVTRNVKQKYRKEQAENATHKKVTGGKEKKCQSKKI